jgi:DNA processing protein
MIKPKSLPYLLALHSVYGIGSVRLKKLVEHFKDPKEAWEAKLPELKKLGLDDKALARLDEKRKTVSPEDYFSDIKKNGIKVLTIWDKNYPTLLKEIYDPPAVLYYQGDISYLNRKAIGVVGTRKISGYGQQVTESLTADLVGAGLVIVSGLARGVDSVAHRTALKNGGKTVAVLAGGLNLIYPPENEKLAKEISSGNGAVISEFPPNYPHLAGNFPTRNRIISGLSIGVLVTEAAQDSGSLITARAALEQGREVFAVPGPINSFLSEGPANLIRNGAQLIMNYKDILDTLGLEYSPKNMDTKSIQLSGLDEEIIDCLDMDSKHMDDICRELRESTAEISANLIRMEIQGLVKNLGGGVYISQVRK